MKNFILRVWIATPVFKNMEYIEYTCNDVSGVYDFLEWKKDRLSQTHGEKNVVVRLCELFETKKIDVMKKTF